MFNVKSVVAGIALLLLAGAPAQACRLPADADRLVHEVVQRINAERRGVGLHPLRKSPTLARGAQIHACDNAAHNRLSHIGTDGSSPGDRVLRVGYGFDFVTENVAIGYLRPGRVVQAWLHSTGHRKNIFERRKDEIGVAVAVGRDGRRHWVMNGGMRRVERHAARLTR
jgi:uncharacterized protein YkwD